MPCVSSGASYRGLVPGSLIFVVIVAVWAAYLVQHWVHRREDAAATRSVDSFSEAMRVLQKRPLFPSTSLSTPRPDSWDVVPGRTARPIVDVKRALPVGASRPLSPLVARRLGLGSAAGSQAPTLPTAPAALGESADSAGRVTDGPHLEEPMSQQPTRSHRTVRSDERPATSSHGPSLARRRFRAGLLLASLLWVPTSIVLAAVGVLLWMSVPFAFLTVVAVLVYLRTEVAADRARAAGDSDHHAEEYSHEYADEYADDEDTDDWAQTGHATAERELTSDDTQVIHAPSHRPAAPSRPRSAAAVFDVQAPVSRTPRHDQAPAAPAEQAQSAPAHVAQPADGTWVPVPVPTPTYAMKAKAPTRLTESGIPADVFATPEFADEADELDDRALFARRAVSQ